MNSSASLEQMRHSAAHLLAMAVLKLRPEAKLGIGPVIDNGFYYDLDLKTPLTNEDLPKLEALMRQSIKADFPFIKEVISRDDAKKLFAHNVYKLELIDDLPASEPISIYKSGDFIDLCRGPHVNNSGEISSAFKLTSLAGAYWRGDEKRPMLQRVYGVLFATQEELAVYLDQLEEAKKRDHRKLGQDLELFSIINEVGPGLPLFYPKGTILRRLVEDYIERVQSRQGYQQIWIPHITKGELYKISGHLDKYAEIYPAMKLPGEADYYLKPMNCPHFMMLYKTLPKSYRDLPIRWTSTTTNYRLEKSGELSGLTRVRSLTQDDCHVFCSDDQVADEIKLMLDMIGQVYQDFGFNDFYVRLSTHDPEHFDHYIGDQKAWLNEEANLEKLLKERGWNYQLGVGEAAFYGPKLDFIAKDALGREWQLSTIQVDRNLPERFDLTYTSSDGGAKRPVVIHRAILGSTERFLGIIIEHYAGDFPLWLAPVQVAILPISEKFLGYADAVAHKLKETGLRVWLDDSNESIGKKIRHSETLKYPLMIVVGEKEAKVKTIAVRARAKAGDESISGEMTVDEFLRVFNFTPPDATKK